MELALAIKGKLDASLPESVKKAISETAGLRQKMQELNKIKIKADKLKELTEKAQEAGKSLSTAKSHVAAVSSEFEKSRLVTEQYKIKLEQAKVAAELMKKTASAQEYAKARMEVIQLNAAYRNSNTATKALAKELAAANREARSAGNAYNKAQNAARKLGDELRKAGFDTDSFAESQNRLQKELSQTEASLAAAKKVQADYNASQAQKAAVRETHAQKQSNFYVAAGNLQSGAMAIQSFVAPIMECVDAAMKFESVMADVKKVVDFDTPQQFKEMNSDILNLSRTLPMAANDIAKIVAAGGQSGIARQDLMAFAESATKMGIAFDITADQAGDMMAKWRTAFKLGQSDVVALADKINYLGNTTAASAPLISDVVTRIGPLGEIGGIASGEIAAMGASMIGAGVQSDVAATGIKNFMMALTTGESASQTQIDTFTELGLDYKAVAQDMQRDSKATILNVLHTIKALDKAKQAAAMRSLFGLESIGAIAPMLSNLEALEDNFTKVADATQYAGSMEAEYAARSQTTENQLQLARNTVTAMSISIGSALLPAINSVMSAVAPVAAAFADFAENNQQLIVVLAGIGTAIAGVVIACLAVNAAVAAYGMVLSTFSMLRSAIAGVSVAQTILNAVMALNPYLLIAMAVIALVGALVYLWQTNDSFREAVLGAWQSLQNGAMAIFTGLADFIGGIWQGIVSTAMVIFTGLADFISGVWQGIVSTAMAVWSAVAPAFAAAWSVISTIAKGIFVVVALVVLTAIELIVGIIRTGIQAIIAIWSLIQPHVSLVWNGICTASNVALAFINAAMAACGAFIGTVWQMILAAANMGWTGIMSVVMAVWAAIAPIVATGAAFIMAIWNQIYGTASAAWNTIVSVVLDVWAQVQGIVATGAAFIMAIWNQIYSTASAAWNAIVSVVLDVWAQVQGIVDSGIAMVEEKWNHLKEIFSSPIQAVVNFVKGGNSEAQSAASDKAVEAGLSATGGIFSQPYLTWVAEAGDTEVIIPINNTTRALQLWQTAGKMLGAYHPAAQAGMAANKAKSASAATISNYVGGAVRIANQQSYMGDAIQIAGQQSTIVADARTLMENSRMTDKNTVIAPATASSTGNVSVEFAPVINITGTGGNGESANIADIVRRALAEQKAQFEDRKSVV